MPCCLADPASIACHNHSPTPLLPPPLQVLNVVAKGLLPSRVEAALAALPAARQAQLVVTKQVDKELLWCCADKLLAAAAVEEMQAAGR